MGNNIINGNRMKHQSLLSRGIVSFIIAKIMETQPSFLEMVIETSPCDIKA